jgi:hypothetical protein
MESSTCHLLLYDQVQTDLPFAHEKELNPSKNPCNYEHQFPANFAGYLDLISNFVFFQSINLLIQLHIPMLVHAKKFEQSKSLHLWLSAIYA